MKKIIAVVVLFFFLFPRGYSQYNPEINKQLEVVKEASYNDSLKLYSTGEAVIKLAKQLSFPGAIAEVHIYYGNHLYYIRDLNKAEVLFGRALKEAQKANTPSVEMLARIRLSFIKYEKADKEEAVKELYELLDESKSKKDYKNVAELYNLIGIIKEESNNSNEAIVLYLEGMKLSDQHNLNYYPAVFRNNIGLMKMNAGKTDEAIEDFNKGLEIAEKEKNGRLSSHIQMNICFAYIIQNKYEKVTSLFSKVIAYSRKNNLPIELSTNYLMLASALFDTGKEDLSNTYYDSSINVSQKFSLNSELTKAYFGKTQVYLKQNNIQEATSYLQKAKTVIERTNDLRDRSNYYYLHYQISEKQNNFKEALNNYLEFTNLKDSIQKKNNVKILEEMQLQYNVQKKETELEKERSKSILLEKKNEEEKYLEWLIIAIALIVLALIAGLSYLRYNRMLTKKQEQFSRQLIKNIEEERQRIARDLHDDIGQSLSIIKSKMVMEKQDQAKQPNGIGAELGRVIEQTREISRQLYPSNLEKIGLTRAVASMMENIQKATGMECSFELSEKVDNFPIDMKTHCFRIIQECTNNTMKHSGATGLKISIKEKIGDYILVYQDNGVGIKNKNRDQGIGLRSIIERAKMINGSFEIDEKMGKGFKLIIRFKPV